MRNTEFLFLEEENYGTFPIHEKHDKSRLCVQYSTASNFDFSFSYLPTKTLIQPFTFSYGSTDSTHSHSHTSRYPCHSPTNPIHSYLYPFTHSPTDSSHSHSHTSRYTCHSPTNPIHSYLYPFTHSSTDSSHSHCHTSRYPCHSPTNPIHAYLYPFTHPPIPFIHLSTRSLTVPRTPLTHLILPKPFIHPSTSTVQTIQCTHHSTCTHSPITHALRVYTDTLFQCRNLNRMFYKGKPKVIKCFIFSYSTLVDRRRLIVSFFQGILKSASYN